MGCPRPSKSSSRAGESLMFFQFQLSTGTFGSTWSVLGASWAQLGASWAPFGHLLASTWALLGPTWRHLGRLRAQFGHFGGQLGTNLSPLWAILGALGVLLGTLGRLWTLQGRSRLEFGAPAKAFGVSDRRFRRLRGSILESLVIVSGVCDQRRHGTSKAHQATTTNQDRRERNYNNDATTTQVGRGS